MRHEQPVVFYKGELMKEITELQDFREIKERGMGYVLITDNATGNKVHDVSCGHVTENFFTRKVIEEECKNGNYYLIDDIEGALRSSNATKCYKCME